jgi:hypothetical protein
VDYGFARIAESFVLDIEHTDGVPGLHIEGVFAMHASYVVGPSNRERTAECFLTKVDLGSRSDVVEHESLY